MGDAGSVLMWRVRYQGWEYFEDDEYDEMVAMVTEAALKSEYGRDNSGRAFTKRRRLRAWVMRGTDDTSYEAERKAGLHNGSEAPQVYALVGGEWVEVEWTLVEPTVVLALPAIESDEAQR